MIQKFQKVDVIVIGSGLAGASLYQILSQRGQDVLLVHKELSGASSEASAGLVSPFTGRDLKLTWQFLEFWSEAQAFYDALDPSLLDKSPHRRCFVSEKQAEKFDTLLSKYPEDVRSLLIHRFGADASAAPFGGFVVQAARLDVCRYLTLVREQAALRRRLLSAEIDVASQLTLFEGGATLTLDRGLEARESWQARHVVFCEGHRLIHNPYFCYLPLRPLKGEFVAWEISAKEWPCAETALVREKWLLKEGESRLRVGASFDRGDQSYQSSDKVAKELALAARSILPELELKAKMDHRFGMRPVCQDHRPVLGKHPEYSQLFVLNGMGSKGSVMAPRLARILAASLLTNEDIPRAMNCARWDRRRTNDK